MLFVFFVLFWFGFFWIHNVMLLMLLISVVFISYAISRPLRYLMCLLQTLTF